MHRTSGRESHLGVAMNGQPWKYPGPRIFSVGPQGMAGRTSFMSPYAQAVPREPPVTIAGHFDKKVP